MSSKITALSEDLGYRKDNDLGAVLVKKKNQVETNLTRRNALCFFGGKVELANRGVLAGESKKLQWKCVQLGFVQKLQKSSKKASRTDFMGINTEISSLTFHCWD